MTYMMGKAVSTHSEGKKTIISYISNEDDVRMNLNFEQNNRFEWCRIAGSFASDSRDATRF